MTTKPMYGYNGPKAWIIYQGGSHIIVCESPGTHMQYDSRGVSNAGSCSLWNGDGTCPAQLLREAAPDLLAACRDAAAQSHHPSCRASRGRDIGNRCQCFVGKARAAIAKAEGKAVRP